MTYPYYVEKVINMINAAGHEAFVVGGAVRDMMLGRENHDFDLTTSALPEETAEIFADYHVIKTGLKHGTVTVVIDKIPLEITTYRIDGDYKDSRRPEGVTFTRCLEEDLARRDFTVNAMAYNAERGVVDLYGGAEDLKAGLIRAVGEPERRFTEDALRIMRAFRFVSKLGFDIEEKTLAAAEACRFGLENISQERKTAELEGILLGAFAQKAVLLMAKTKTLEIIAQGVKFAPSRLEKLGELPQDFTCRLAFCLAHTDNYDNYISTLRLSNSVASRTKKLIKLSVEKLSLDTAPSLRAFMATAGEELEYILEIKKALGEKVDGILPRTQKIRDDGDCLFVKDLAVDGRDLAVMGVKGKALGEILSKLLDFVLEEPERNQRKILLTEAERLAREMGEEQK